jgi:hypothetical protein
MTGYFSWGSVGRFSEFGREKSRKDIGALLQDMQLPILIGRVAFLRK